MRTNIDIDNDLIKAAQEATGLKTKKAVVEEGLRRIVKCRQQVAILKELEGSADWEGDLKAIEKGQSLRPMVIVDSSVWIDLLRRRETPETLLFKRIAADEEVGLGDLILYEVLQGVKPAERLEKIKSRLLRLPVFTMGGRDIALEAVHNAQALRVHGVQPQIIDCLIATFCIVSGSRLLTSDRDFLPFQDVLGLGLALAG